MKDIARDLGVSVVTVSKVLRNHSDISRETRERVLRRMKELNYQPDPAARALVTGRSHLVGLIVPDLVHPFFAEIAKNVSRALRDKGYALIIASSEEDPDLERQEIQHMLARRLDALIIASTQWNVESFHRIEEYGKPYVLIDRKFGGLAAHFVGTDDVAVGRIAVQHLAGQGCRRIGYIGGQHVSTALDRLEGYRRGLSDAGLPAAPELVICRAHIDDSGDVTGYEAARNLLRLADRPDGLFCYNDPMAMGAMRAVLEAGVRIPAELAIVGCGNVRYGASLRVPLSSVDQESEALGQRAAKVALALMERKGAVRPRQTLIAPRLVARESSLRQTR